MLGKFFKKIKTTVKRRQEEKEGQLGKGGRGNSEEFKLKFIEGLGIFPLSVRNNDFHRGSNSDSHAKPLLSVLPPGLERVAYGNGEQCRVEGRGIRLRTDCGCVLCRLTCSQVGLSRG